MAKQVIEGWLVQEKYERDGKKLEPKNLGVCFSEFEVQELIQRESGYYEEQPFKFCRNVYDRMIVYYEGHKNESITYTWDKCLVIPGV